MLEGFVLSGSNSHSQRQVLKCNSHTFWQSHVLAASVAQELYSEVPFPVLRCHEVPQFLFRAY